MATEPTAPPNYADEALRLMERLQGLAQITDGLGAASETLIIASNVLDETNRQIGSLNASASTAVAAIDRLQPDQLREWIESGLASVRETIAESGDRGQEGVRNAEHAVQTLGRQTASDLEALEIEFKERAAEITERVVALRTATTNAFQESGRESIKRFDGLSLQVSDGFNATQTLAITQHDNLSQQANNHHAVLTTAAADAALRILDGIDQMQRRLAANQTAMQQAFAEIRGEQAAMAAALAALQQRQQALAEQAQAIAAVADAIKTTTDATRQAAANIETAASERSRALTAELQSLRTQLAAEARAAARRQTAYFLATILLLAVAGYVVIWAIRGAL